MAALVESLPFGMGVTRANFKQSGKIPVHSQLVSPGCEIKSQSPPTKLQVH